jgi:hypothetical protein
MIIIARANPADEKSPSFRNIEYVTSMDKPQNIERTIQALKTLYGVKLIVLIFSSLICTRAQFFNLARATKLMF